MRRAFAISLLCIAPALSACGGGGKKDSDRAATDQNIAGPSCKRVSAPRARGKGHEKKPKKQLDASKSWRLMVQTNCGGFTIALDVKRAPHASASLVALARSGFYDGTTFHRIVREFVIQGGDPTGTGKGGPGYTTVDRPPPSARYTRGVVAMAKKESEPAGVAGSQFFVVTGQDTGLHPDYAIVGRVTHGLDVVEKIGRLGDPATERPTQPIVISRIAVKRG